MTLKFMCGESVASSTESCGEVRRSDTKGKLKLSLTEEGKASKCKLIASNGKFGVYVAWKESAKLTMWSILELM